MRKTNTGKAIKYKEKQFLLLFLFHFFGHKLNLILRSKTGIKT